MINNLKTVRLTLLSKGRIYFKCKLENGCDAKIFINSKTENLELNKEHELLVEDQSIASKYGSNIIYEAKDQVKKEKVILLKAKKIENLSKNSGILVENGIQTLKFGHFLIL